MKQYYDNQNGSEVILTEPLPSTAYFSDPDGVIYSLYTSGQCNYIGTVHVDVKRKTVSALGGGCEGRNERPVLWEADLNFSLLAWTELGHKTYEESADVLREVRLWLERQDEDIAKGLRSLEDAVKLYTAFCVEKPTALAHVTLPRYADDYDFHVDTEKGPAYATIESIHKVILGYSPIEENHVPDVK